MTEQHSYDCVDHHRCDLALVKSYRDAVIPVLMGDPSSVMYQVVVTMMGQLVTEVECSRRWINADPAYSGEASGL